MKYTFLFGFVFCLLLLTVAFGSTTRTITLNYQIADLVAPTVVPSGSNCAIQTNPTLGSVSVQNVLWRKRIDGTTTTDTTQRATSYIFPFTLTPRAGDNCQATGRLQFNNVWYGETWGTHTYATHTLVYSKSGSGSGSIDLWMYHPDWVTERTGWSSNNI